MKNIDTPIYDQAYAEAIEHTIDVDDMETLEILERMDEDTRPAPRHHRSFAV